MIRSTFKTVTFLNRYLSLYIFYFNIKRTLISWLLGLITVLSVNKKYDFIPVYSSYNGFAIYKSDKFLNCSYSSNIDITLFPKKLLPPQIINKFTNDCEHRKFHLEAIKKNKARIVVSPLSIFYKLPIRNPGLRGPAWNNYFILLAR